MSEFDRKIPPLQQFLRLVDAPVIGVAGSLYVDEVANLIADIMRRHWRDQLSRIVHSANVLKLPEIVDHIREDDLVVLKLSPNDLADCHHSPHIGVITGVGKADKLSDDEFNNQAEAMLNIIRYQQDGDAAVYNDEDPILHEVTKVIVPDTMADAEAVPGRESAYYYDGGFYYAGEEIATDIKFKELSEGDKLAICLAIAATWEISGHDKESIGGVLTSPD